MRWVLVTGSSARQRSFVAANLAVLAALGRRSAHLRCEEPGFLAAATERGVFGELGSAPTQGLGFCYAQVPDQPAPVMRLHLLDSTARAAEGDSPSRSGAADSPMFHVEQPGALALVCRDVDELEREIRKRRQQALEPALPYRVPPAEPRAVLPVIDAAWGPDGLAFMELFQEVLSHVG